MFHTVAYHGAVTASGTLAALTPVTDPTVTINGNHILVPDKYNQVLGAAVLDTSSSVTRAQLQSPSLREMFFPEVRNVVAAGSWEQYFMNTLNSDSPLPVKTNEGLDFYQNGGGASSTQFGLVWLSDGAVTPVKGSIFTMYATAAITPSSTEWVNGALTFDQTLPVGNYQVVGMKVAAGAAGGAGRLVFVGASAITRPGVPCHQYTNQSIEFGFRYGAAGTFGTFNSLTPPSLDLLGGTGAAQEIWLDLMAAA